MPAAVMTPAGSKVLTEADSHKIDSLIQEAKDPTLRAALLLMLGQQDALRHSIEMIGRSTESLNRFERAFDDHRVEFREHITSEDAMLRTSIAIGKIAAGVIALLIGSTIAMGTWMFQSIARDVARDALEQQRMAQQIEVNTKRLEFIEQKVNK